MANLRRYTSMPLAVLVTNAAVAAAITCSIDAPTAAASLQMGVPVVISGSMSKDGSVLVSVGATVVARVNGTALGGWSTSYTFPYTSLGAQAIHAVATATVGGGTGNATDVAVTITPLDLATVLPTPGQSVQTDFASVVYGSTMKLQTGGSGTSVQSLTGTIVGSTVPIRTKCTTAGTVGSGAVFSASFDGGSTFPITGLTPTAGVPIALTGAGTGMSIAWAAGTGVLNEVSDATCSQIKDRATGANHFNQAVATKQPIIAPGKNGCVELIGDGVDDVMTSSRNIVAPGTQATTIYLVMRLITWGTGVRYVSDNTGGGHTLIGGSSSPSLLQYSGNQVASQDISPGSYECTSAVFTNSASDYMRRGDNAKYFGGTAGNSASTGRALFAWGTSPSLFANMAVLGYFEFPYAVTDAQDSAFRSAIREKYGDDVRIGATIGTGSVANGARQSVQASSALPYQVEKVITAAVDFDELQVAWPNYYGVSETGTGAPITITASLKTTDGAVLGQFKFGGTATGTIASKDDLTSDRLKLPSTVLAGTDRVLSFHWSGANGVPCITGAGRMSTARGDKIEQTATDKTMGGTVVDGGLNLGMFPVRIIGKNSGKTIVLAGDSKVHGVLDVMDTTGNVGELERSFAPSVACINIAVSGDTANNFANNAYSIRARRMACASYGTHIVSNFATNDIAIPRTAAQLITDHQKMNTTFWPGKPYYLLTCTPHTAGTYTAVNGSDQTVDSNDAARLTFNTTVRAGASGFTGFYDTTPVACLAGNNAKWNADGTPGKYTADGIHETAYCNTQYNFPVPA